MKKLDLAILTLGFVTALCCSSPVFTQQPSVPSDKRALIQEILELTGMRNISSSQKIDSINIKSSLVNWAEREVQGLADDQKAEVKKLSLEAGERIELQVRQFSEDKAVIEPMFRESCFQVYDRSFSETELREMVVFYRTPTGQKTAKFMMTMLDKTTKAFAEVFKEKFKEFAGSKLLQEQQLLRRRIQEMKRPKLDA